MGQCSRADWKKQLPVATISLLLVKNHVSPGSLSRTGSFWRHRTQYRCFSETGLKNPVKKDNLGIAACKTTLAEQSFSLLSFHRIVVVDDDEAGRLNAEQLHTGRQSGQHSH